MENDERDAGQVLPLVAVLILLAALSIVLVGRVGSRLSEQARARTAADAVALAGAADGRAGAELVARENGAAIIGWFPSGDGVQVAVRVGRATAIARAVRDCTRPARGDLLHFAGCPPSRPG